MSKIQTIRLKLNLTQEELCERSGISVRTIQRIESGMPAKGYTLKALAKGLDIPATELIETEQTHLTENLTWLKIINLCALPLMFLPPLNILGPLALMAARKQFTPLTKRLLTLQILWSLIAALLVVTIVILNDVFQINGPYLTLIPATWLLVNAVVILANAAKLADSATLYIDPKFSLF